MAMKVVTPTPTPVASLVMRAAHALCRRWMSSIALVGEYRDVLRSALRFAWDCARGRAGTARLPRFASATPRVWRNVIVASILAAKGVSVTTSSSRAWLAEGESFRLGHVPIRMIPSLLGATTVGYAYCAATGHPVVFWN